MSIINHIKQFNIFIGVSVSVVVLSALLYVFGVFDGLAYVSVAYRHPDFEKDVYLSKSGSYIGIFADHEGDEATFEYTLVPRDRFEQNAVQSVHTGVIKGQENLPHHTYDYPDHEKFRYPYEETEWDGNCSLVPEQIKKNQIRISAGCGEENELHSFTLHTNDIPVPDSDLPLYFNGDSHYESPLSDCITFSANTADKKTICNHYIRDRHPCNLDDYCTDHKIRFANTKTQKQITKTVPGYVTENGFLDDGTFYALLRHGYDKGVYVVPSEYFRDNL